MFVLPEQIIAFLLLWFISRVRPVLARHLILSSVEEFYVLAKIGTQQCVGVR